MKLKELIKMAKFEMGRIYLTKTVFDRISANEFLTRFVIRSLRRFAEADWGEMDEEDKETNNNALETGSRLFGSYECAHAKIWIITEADRSCTTILFPSEY